MHLRKKSYILPLSFLSSISSYAHSKSLPVVDLGYELHQAFSLDQSTQAYNFSNIRFAAPPVSTQRFRPPLPPSTNRTEIQNGAVGRVCPQGEPIWSTEILIPFFESILTGTPFNGSDDISDYPIVWPPGDARVTEDCLFLDVVVPKSVFEGSEAAPVLVWFDGGGFVTGDKTEVLPTGLLERGSEVGEDFVYVAVNYRLGAFGWLSDGEGLGNAGLYDQRLALEWVKEYISLFGGDPGRVTVMGESAGGGSIVHQLAASTGVERELPFQQAIIQSPGWYMQSVELQKSTFQQFLELLNVTSLEEARQLPSNQLITANAYQIATTSVYGTYTYGPVIDNSFITDLPSRILLDPDFKWKNIRVMTSHTINEGLTFTPPVGVNSSAFQSLIKTYIPDLAPETVDRIAQYWYPPVYNASSSSSEKLGYNSPLERTSTFMSDAFFQCKNLYLDNVFDTSYASVFSVPPGVHAQDVAFNFWDHSQPDTELGPFSESLALTMQDYIITFVNQGFPTSAENNATEWEAYSKDGRVMNLGLQDIAITSDPVNTDRCRFWWNITG
ncbi:carboxylesterase family protein [Aspergillus vadensis CBS 113365]|uniref:Carboxylic ester hydrolase n=1 Tax=Aspergillus vadensis (strain CBS 113365 / IMI 142717 / IBT 24658) TaxID=1448311 RepID=A0A319BXC7_ASPVC|nr:carboxylesterase family protein [Aspergillus vadensis CBS 113365]PYH70533.1 carboxylesterase family protein [Aspergillus vadensis CBS 113365]